MRRIDLLDDFTLLLVDDHPLFRDGLTAALHHHAPGLKVQSVGTVDQALKMLSSQSDMFDLVLLDYHLPGLDGLHCASLLMQQHPGIAVGLMSGLEDPTLLYRAREAGLCAYLPKSLEITALLDSLCRLAQGEPAFSALEPSPVPSDPTSLTTGQLDTSHAHSSESVLGLTSRQLEVLQALAQGSSNKEIARAIGISPSTVKKHLEAVFYKLGASNRLQAVVMARAMLTKSAAPHD